MEKSDIENLNPCISIGKKIDFKKSPENDSKIAVEILVSTTLLINHGVMPVRKGIQLLNPKYAEKMLANIKSPRMSSI